MVVSFSRSSSPFFKRLKNMYKLLFARKFLFLFTGLTFAGLLIPDHANGMKGLYHTKAAAEKAASKFGCSGAHKMGKKWMPCSMHEVHDQELNH